MRDPSDVINRILAIVPREEHALRDELERIKNDAWFYPPEGKFPAWAVLTKALEARCPGKPPEGSWLMKVSKIVRDIE
jgi:hypothetical protein